ncbi:MAG: large repetitive protein [Pseudonocardiales bacterium]|nr:large repetitive protein [Pseudonocardiales bacterium]
MTGPRFTRDPDEPAPAVLADPLLRTGAGTAVIAHIMITNRAPEPRIIAVTALGVDAGWLPKPSRSRPVLPGESIAADVTLSPAAGTVPARYPLAIAVQALDPVSERATSATVISDIMLVVDAPGQIAVELSPADVTGVFGKRVTVTLHNSGATPASVHLEARAPQSTEIRLATDPIDVGPGESRSVPARVKVAHPRLFGTRARHTYTVTARGSGAPRHVQGSLTTRAVFGPGGTKAVVLVSVVALWLVLAVVFIPKLANHVKGGQPQAGAPNKHATTSAGSGSGSGSASGGTKAGSGSKKSGGAAGGLAGAGATAVQLNGTVTGDSPGGVRVAMSPTSLVDTSTAGATLVGVEVQSSEIGKIAQGAVLLTTPRTVSQDRSATTGKDGAWSFPRVKAPGYYLLVFSKPGYQTQRFVIDSSAAVATQPMKVALTPGQGILRGSVSGPGGRLGGAQLTLTDGTNTITTSSVSTGDIGSWSVNGLSTPGSYLISASKDGMGTESELITLDAGGTASVALTLKAGVASLVGAVKGRNSLGKMTGLGGATVTATDGSVTRTASTVTRGPIGNYTLTDLAPGSYSVTVQAAGYLTQTQGVTVTKGQSQVRIDASLTLATAVVTGTVRGAKFDGAGVPTGATGPLNGAGLILASAANMYKITSGVDGAFRFNGVAPGTYVLSAQYSGLTTGFVTVKAVAGEEFMISASALNLGVETSANTSTITGFVASAVSPNGSLAASCPDNTTPGHGCEVRFTLVDSDGTAVNTHTKDGDPFVATPQTDPATAGPTGYTLSAALGLAPGLYHLTIIADGFLPATIAVRVPLNGVAVAPQVNLFPGNVISGTVGALGNIIEDGPSPPYENCVWAIPVATGATQPTGCAFTPPVPSQCQSKGLPAIGFAKIAADNSYKLADLCDGTYNVYVFMQNPYYINPAPTASQTVTHGQTVTYSPHVLRKGRVSLTLTKANSASGAVSALGAGVAVTATCTAPSLSSPLSPVTRDLTTDSESKIIVAGLTTATWGCTVKGGTAAAPTTQVGQTSGLSVAPDNDAPGQITLAATVGTFYGRITTSWEGTSEGVGNTAVVVTGVTGYANGSAQTTSASVTTDTNGCFAFSPDGVQAPAGPAECSTDTTIPTTAFPLVVSSATFQATPPDGFQGASRSVPNLSGVSLVNIGVVPNPVAITGLLTSSPAQNATTSPPVPDLSGASIQVLQAPPGAGSIAVSSDSTGHLSWHDTNINDPNQPAQPGTYKLVANLTGYVTAQITFKCLRGVPCDINAANAFVLNKFGGLTISTVNAVGAAIPDASFTLFNGTSQVGTQSPAAGGNSVPFTGLSPGAVYRVHIQAAGYQFGDTGTSLITLDCGPLDPTPITITPGAVTTCTATLIRDGAIGGTVTGIIAHPSATSPTRPIGGVVVTAARCTDTKDNGSDGLTYCTAVSTTAVFTASSNVSTGVYRIIGTRSNQLTTGNWLVTAAPTGFIIPAVPAGAAAGALSGALVAVSSLSADTTYSPTFYIDPVDVTVDVTDQGANPVDGLRVTMVGTTLTAATQCTGPEAANTTCPGGGHRSYLFTNVIPGLYTVQATGSNIITQTMKIDVTLGAGAQTFSMPVSLGANLASGTVTGLQNADAGATALAGVRVCVIKSPIVASNTCAANAANGTDGKPMINAVGGTAADGVFAFDTIPDDSFYFHTERRYGYAKFDGLVVAYNHTHAAPAPVTLLVPRIKQQVVVTVSASSTSDDLTGSTLGVLTTAGAPPIPANAPLSKLPVAPVAGTPSKFTVTISDVPYGCWTFSFTKPAQHFGTLSGPSGTGTDATLTCPAGAFLVSGTAPAAPADLAVGYSLTEYQPHVVVTATKLALDTAPLTVTLTVGPVAAPIFTDAAFAIGAAGAALPIWLNSTQTVTADVGRPGWPADTGSVSTAASSTSIALAEQGATVVVHFTGTFPVPTALATVSLVSPDGTITAPAAKTVATGASGATVTFTNVPFFAGWVANATVTYTVAAVTGPPAVAAHDETQTGTATFNITTTTPATVPVPMS